MDYCVDHTNCSERITAVEESTKSAHKRIDALAEDYKVLHEMNANIKVLAEQYKTQGIKIETIEVDVKDLKNKPGKQWDSFKTTVLASIIGLIVGFLFQEVMK